MEHEEAVRQIYLTTRAFLTENEDRERIIDKLIEEGLSPVAASLRVDLVPMAFGWGLLKKMGVKKFPSEFELSDSGAMARVSESHVFVAALGLAIDVFERGYTEIFSQRVVEMLVSHSAEFDSLNKALHTDPSLDLAEVSFSSSLNGYSVKEYIENA